jgi:hypothetical protein
LGGHLEQVFTTELEDPIALEKLVGGNAKLEQAVTETSGNCCRRIGQSLAGKWRAVWAPVGRPRIDPTRYEF